MNLKCGFLHFKFSIFLNYNELPATHFVHERHNGTASGTLEPVLVPGRQCKAELKRATRQRTAGKPGRWARARRSPRERRRRASLSRGGGASWVSSLLQV